VKAAHALLQCAISEHARRDGRRLLVVASERLRHPSGDARIQERSSAYQRGTTGGVGMTRRCITGWVASVLVLVCALIPGVASGAPPTIERIPVDDTFVDDFLSEECGVEVTTRARGHIIVRTFEEDGTGVVEVRTIKWA
jgi:hypothetical protein